MKGKGEMLRDCSKYQKSNHFQRSLKLIQIVENFNSIFMYVYLHLLKFVMLAIPYKFLAYKNYLNIVHASKHVLTLAPSIIKTWQQTHQNDK